MPSLWWKHYRVRKGIFNTVTHCMLRWRENVSLRAVLDLKKMQFTEMFGHSSITLSYTLALAWHPCYQCATGGESGKHSGGSPHWSAYSGWVGRSKPGWTFPCCQWAEIQRGRWWAGDFFSQCEKGRHIISSVLYLQTLILQHQLNLVLHRNHTADTGSCWRGNWHEDRDWGKRKGETQRHWY